MARPKNEKTRDLLASEAYRLFFEVGYEATTYQAIADRGGVTRALVQHYFPAKIDLAVGLFRWILTDLAGSLGAAAPGHPIQNLLVIGEGFFGFLLRDPRSRRLTLDILSSRSLTAEVLAFNLRWALDFVGTPPPPDRVEALEDNVTSAMGGFYELLFQRLRSGRPFDLHTQLSRVVAVFWEGFGLPFDQASAVLSATVLTDPGRRDQAFGQLDRRFAAG